MSTIQTYEWTGGQLADTKATSATLCPGRLRRVLVAIMATRVIAAAAMGQPGEIPGDDLSELSLEELMNEEITSAATPGETSARITPAAMTTITAEQIQAWIFTCPTSSACDNTGGPITWACSINQTRT